jgi:hypothetical protein
MRRVVSVEFGFDLRTTAGIQHFTLRRSVESDFTNWYRGAASAPFGSAFLYLQSFSVQPKVSIDSVTVTLINRRKVLVSNLDKILFPHGRVTKGQVIDYYLRISGYLLPHSHDRPVTLKRYPKPRDRPRPAVEANASANVSVENFLLEIAIPIVEAGLTHS